MKRLLLLGLATVVASCTTVGEGRAREPQPAEASQLLQPGRTTLAEAERLLGAGRALRLDSGWSTLHYVYRDGLPRFLNFVPIVGLVTSSIATPETELVLLFDEQGQLRKFKLRQGI